MADEKVSLSPAAGPLTGAEIIPAVQDGDNVQTTAQDIADLGGGGSASSVGFVSMQEQTAQLPPGWTVDFIGTGEASIQTTLPNPGAQEFYIPQATIQHPSGVGQVGVITIAGVTNAVLSVKTYNSAGAAADLDFYFEVSPLTTLEAIGGGD